MVVEEYVKRAYRLYKELSPVYYCWQNKTKKITTLMPIPVDYPFQFLGLDVMELLFTTYGNKYLIAFQDLFTKWPMEFPTPDQKTV